MEPISIILLVVIIIMSVVVHEVAHGYAALWLGDSTAHYAGRLTLNPIKHLDLFGSVIVPLLLSFSGMVFGWAKPVPYNPYNLRNRRWGELLVAIAGPISNILLAVIFGMFIRLTSVDSLGMTSVMYVASLIVHINIVLAIFNLIPVPPLDGSKILFAILPNQYNQIKIVLERFGFIIILFFIIFLWQMFSPIIDFFFKLITGF
ncbi:MAG: site-2 protease family protein [Candidatus Paceibacterota bacterium]